MTQDRPFSGLVEPMRTRHRPYSSEARGNDQTKRDTPVEKNLRLDLVVLHVGNSVQDYGAISPAFWNTFL